MKKTILFCCILFSAVGALSAQNLSWNRLEFFTKDSTFRKAIEPEEGAAELARLKDLFNTTRSWEERKERLRKGIREALLLPDEQLKPNVPASIFTGRIVKDGYAIENVAIEIMPGLWAIGNLYRPLSVQSGKHPAILSAQGHGPAEVSEKNARFSKSSQTMCASLAKMGAVVYNYDMFGIGESGLHAGHSIHRTGLAQSIQTLTSTRIVDFLISLPDVDAKRIGMTGASGGGTQTFLATAIDPRIAVSVPVVQVSCFFPGGCPCESGRPIHLMCSPISNNAEIAALAAPRPMLVVSDGGDWTRTVNTQEYPFIKRIYSFYGKEKLSENVHLPNEKHDYGPSKRHAMYDFMAKHLGLNNKILKNAAGEYVESVIFPVEWEELLVFPDKKLPEGHLKSIEEIYTCLVRGK
ncbi:alpha/beta hydrolase family protein [Viscerimonas tarda]